jgi:hypothetical protein
MIAPLLVTVVIEGAPVASSVPAVLLRGVVSAPLDPFVRRIAQRISGDGERYTLERGDRVLTFALGERFARAGSTRFELPFAPYADPLGDPFVPLAACARALGQSVSYDAASRTIFLAPAAPLPLVTMTPYAAQPAPQSPGPTFAPTAAAPTARPTVSGVPQPRRTPIVVTGTP